VNSSALTLAAAGSVGTRGVLSFGNSTIGGAGTFTDSGQITARGNDAINSPFASNAGSVLRVQGNAADGAATLTIADGYVSAGQIQLTSTGGVFDSTLNVTNGTLSIPAGVIVNAVAGTGGNRFRGPQVFSVVTL